MKNEGVADLRLTTITVFNRSGPNAVYNPPRDYRAVGAEVQAFIFEVRTRFPA